MNRGKIARGAISNDWCREKSIMQVAESVGVCKVLLELWFDLETVRKITDVISIVAMAGPCMLELKGLFGRPHIMGVLFVLSMLSKWVVFSPTMK